MTKAKIKRNVSISVYFPVPREVAAKISECKTTEDRSTNNFLSRLIAARVKRYKENGTEIPTTGSQDLEIGQFVRLPAELVDDIDIMAEAHGRTRTRMVRQLVIDGIVEYPT